VSSNVEWCRTDDAVILLDLKNGRYFGLGRSEREALEELVFDWAKNEENRPPTSRTDRNSVGLPIAERLVERGLLTRHEVQRRVGASSVPMPAEGIPFADVLAPPGVRTSHYANLLAAYGYACYQLRRRSLERIVKHVSGRRYKRSRNACEGLRGQLIYYSRIFLHLRPLVFATRDHCLADSLTLIEFLAEYDLFPSWMVGVRTQPFGAHSWVQYGSLVLNDAPEKVRAYVPILAV
jgi:hypothetical protein